MGLIGASPATPRPAPLVNRLRERRQQTSGRGVREHLVSGLERGLDLLARSEYAMASGLREFMHDNPEDIQAAALRGLRGESRVSFVDIAADELGLSEQPFFAIPDFKYGPDFLEHIARGVLSPAGVTGMALGMVLDPLSWFAIGELTRAGRLGQLSRSAKAMRKPFPFVEGKKLVYPKGSIVAKGSELAEQLEQEFARTGRLPEALERTLGGQARAGQRALLQLAPPFGRPFQVVLPGRQLFEAQTKLRDVIARKAPQVDAAFRLFSNFSIQPETLGDMARSQANIRRRDQNLDLRLHRIGRELGLGTSAYEANSLEVARVIENTERLSEERVRTLTRSVPLEERVVGTGSFLSSTIDEATGKRVFTPNQAELEILRARMGLDPGQRIVNVEELGAQAISSPSFPVSISYRGGMATKGLESLKDEGRFLGLEYAAVPGQTFNPEFVEGANRILVDLDLSGRPEAIQKQIDELTQAISKMPTEARAAAVAKLDGLVHERQRALQGQLPRPWRVMLMRRDAETGRNTILRVYHAKSIEEFYRDVLGPMTLNRSPAEFRASAVFMDDSFIDEMKRLAQEHTRFQKLLSHRGRMSNRFEENVEARKAEVVIERQEDLETIDEFMQTIRQAGHIAAVGQTQVVGSGLWHELSEAYGLYMKKLGRKVDPDILRKEGVDVTNGEQREAFARSLGYEPEYESTAYQQLEDVARDLRDKLQLWTKRSPWQEARDRLIAENDPDWLKLDRYDEALERLGLREKPFGAPGKRGTQAQQEARKRKREFATGPEVEIPETRELIQAEIPIGRKRGEIPKLQVTTEELEHYREILPRFHGVADNIRRAALQLERVYNEYGGELLARDGIRARLPGYLHHARYDTLDRMKRITRFVRMAKNSPIEIRKPGFSRTRTLRDTKEAINERMGFEFFSNDLLSTAALYGREANRYIATYDFVNRTLARLIEDGAAFRVDARKINPNTLDPRMGVYFPKGRLKFFQSDIIPAGRVAKQIRKQIEEGGEGADFMKATGAALVLIQPQDFKKMVGVSRNVPAIVLPREVADYLNRANALYQRPEGLTMIRELLLGVRNVWTRWTLFPFAGYHIRNAIGNVLNNAYRGLFNPFRYEQAYLIQTGKEIGPLKTQAGDLLNTGKIRAELVREGVADAGFYANIAGPASTLDESIRTAFGSKKGWRAALDKYGPEGFIQAGMRVASLVENNARIALYVERRMLGETPDLAAQVVRTTLFDYGDMVPADRFTRSYIAPFWGWTRNNIPFQVKHLLQRPGYFATTERMIRLIQASTDPTSEVLPQWMHEGLPVRLFETPDKKGEFRYFILRNWLPAADLQQLFAPGHSFGSMLAPWWRVPIERALNYSFYFRRPIEPLGAKYGSFLGLEMRRKDIEILRTISLLQAVDQVMGPADNVRTESYLEPNVWSRVLQSRFGVGKLYLVDLQRQKIVAQKQHEKLIRDLKIARKAALRRGDRINAKYLTDKIADEEQRTPVVTGGVPQAIAPAEF